MLSVMRQTLPVKECIIVDDCSTDDSVSRCQRLINGYKGETRFVVLSHEHNRGLSAARNTGTDAATGEWVYFLDSDDEITPDCVERLMTALNSSLSCDDSTEMIMDEYRTELPAMAVKGCGLLRRRSHFARKTALRLCGNEKVREWYFKRTAKPDQGWNKLLRRSFIKENQLRFKEGLLYEDLLWSYFLFGCLNHVALVPEVTYIHHRRPGSIMTETKREDFLKHHGFIFKEIAEQTVVTKRMEDTLRWLPDFCQCYIDAADSQDYQYAYQAFKQQLTDGHQQLAVWKMGVVNYLSKSHTGRRLFHGAIWIKKQIRRIESVL